MSQALGLELVDLSQIDLDPSLLQSFPLRAIHRYGVFPLTREGDSLVVVTGNPLDLQAIDAVSAMLGESVIPVVAMPDEVSKLIKAHFGVGAETVDGLMAQSQDAVEVLDELDFSGSEDAQEAQEASVVRLVNEIVIKAVEVRSSDIHLEAQVSGLKIRYRIDGVLQPQPIPPELNRFQAAIISRLKIMSKMNIAEKRIPQDGRIKLKVWDAKWISAFRSFRCCTAKVSSCISMDRMRCVSR